MLKDRKDMENWGPWQKRENGFPLYRSPRGRCYRVKVETSV